MLLPKKTKFRKTRKGRNDGPATSGNYLAFGDYGIISLEHARVSSRQIEASRQAITRFVKRGGQIWIRIFPHTPVTKKPQDVKMGGGKGNPEYFAAMVKPGTVLFEIRGVDEATAREAMRLAGHKMPVKVKFVKREEN